LSNQLLAVCLDCGHTFDYIPIPITCPRCNSAWLEAHYDYSSLGMALPASLYHRPFNLWRYRELLPVADYNPDLTLGEGGTPLVRAINLGMMLGCPNLFIKDERQGPTNSFKDRQAAISIYALKEAGITEAVLASTGNVAIAYSAYAARAGIKLWAFLTSLVPIEKMREVAFYGTQVVKVTGSYDQAKQVAAEFARQRDLYLERGARSIPSVESMKTIAFEVCEQLAYYHDYAGKNALTESNFDDSSPRLVKFQAPDWYLQSVSGGIGPLGVQKGFFELKEMNLTNRIPAMGNIQAEGCAPMVHAWRKGEEVAEPVKVPRTHIATLSTGDPGRTYTLLFQRMKKSAGGVFESVSDEETFHTMHILAKMEGISVEPAAAVAFAGLVKLVRAGKIKPDDVVVINCTGHTMPVEHDILGDGWSKDVEYPSQALGETPQEGLLAALSRITPDRYALIEIVDDLPDARRLIRRVLQAQGEYTLLEASNGSEALEIAQHELPDLIILDLMMPEMDGFSVLDALKSNAKTGAIPVIVVTAKELTPEEEKRLRGRIHALMQKGEFMSDELMDEVRSVLD